LFQAFAALTCVAIAGNYVRIQYLSLIKANQSLEQEKQKSIDLSQQLAKYLAPQVWNMIFSEQKHAHLETTRKQLTIFCADIQGFTQLSEQLEAEMLTSLLNSYLQDISQIALNYGGTIDKFIGDSIMVFFGDQPSLGAKKDAMQAISMALTIRKHMHTMRRKWQKQGITQTLDIRMGINTGYCTIGNFGTEQRMEYTIIGREVNLASRLESCCTAGEILISQSTYLLIKDEVMCADKGKIQVKGFTLPIQIYEVIDFRHSLGENSDYFDVDLPGFSLSLDARKINYQSRSEIISALNKAIDELQD